MTFWTRGDPSFDSVSTSSLIDRDDGSAYETLREAGYETGDAVVLRDSEVAGGIQTTTSTSFVQIENARKGSGIFLDWGSLPDDATIKMFLKGDASTSNTVVRLADFGLSGGSGFNQTYADTEYQSDGSDPDYFRGPKHTFDPSNQSGRSIYSGVFKSTNGSDAFVRRIDIVMEVVI